MPIELNSYQKGLVVEALVLGELRGVGRVSGEELIERIERRCARLAERRPDFGFVGWLGTTIWGAFESYCEGGLISHSVDGPRSPS